MQFPESWLREFCDPPLSTAALAELLTMAGMEVETLAPVAPPFSGVIVARIVGVEPHPQADRLRVCTVDAGAAWPDGPLQVVCGAPNARVGLLAPLALPGAELPAPAGQTAPLRIAVGRLRGVDSQGMLCSARELHVTEDHGGLMELAADAPPGVPLRQWLRLDDTVFTLKLTPNLGHVLSVQGVAREVAALTGAPLRLLRVAPVAPSSDERLAVTVDAADLCGRFSGRVVRGIDPTRPTPAWMVERLARCGQRSVSALVDISNYVMFECGQPTHVFDLDRIAPPLAVRWGRRGEALTLLSGSRVELDDAVGVIADAHGVESLAGIMGGQATAVSDATRAVYVEAAFWWPDAVAGRSRRFGFSTDAGHRFERGVDPLGTVDAVERITALLLEVCGTADTVCGPVDDRAPALPAPPPVRLRVARAARVLGMPLTQQRCAEALERLGLQPEHGDGVLTVRPPSRRFDLRIEEDLIEEVARVVGYDRLPDTLPLAPVVPRVRSESRRGAGDVRRALAAMGYQETIGFGFVEERWEHELAGNADPIRVLNPIAAPLAVMRSSLVGSLVAVLRRNLAQRAARVRVAEVGRVFRRDATVPDGPLTVAGVDQPMHVGALLYGAADELQWGAPERPVDFFDAKGDVERLLGRSGATFAAAAHPALHPGRSAAVHVDGRAIGFVGELHPRWRLAYELPQAPMLFELDLEPLLTTPLPLFAGLPRQQTVTRDIALVVPEAVTHGTLQAVLRADGDNGGVVRDAVLFDIWRAAQPGPGIAAGERSLALRLSLRDDAQTLTDERIDRAVAAAVARAAALGCRLRG